MELCETVGAGRGRLALLMDGYTVFSGNKLDLGRQGVTWFAVGEEYAPRGRGYAGNFYIDNVTATLTA